MRKLCTLLCIGLVSATMVGCTKNIPSNNEYISKERALDIALNNVSLTKEEIYDLDIDFDNEPTYQVYEISFDHNKIEYEFEIDAISGEILYREPIK